VYHTSNLFLVEMRSHVLFVLGLALNNNPPDIHLMSNQNYRYEPLCLSEIFCSSVFKSVKISSLDVLSCLLSLQLFTNENSEFEETCLAKYVTTMNKWHYRPISGL
jgi:hypothetical protein